MTKVSGAFVIMTKVPGAFVREFVGRGVCQVFQEGVT